MKRARGFTLLELMIVVTIIAILAAVAITAYNKQIRKSRRADAKQVMSAISLAEEKFRSNNTTYGATVGAIGVAATSPYYNFAITFPTTGNCPSGLAKGNANSYILTGTATGDQAKDTTCTPLVMTSDCGAVIKCPGSNAACASSNECW